MSMGIPSASPFHSPPTLLPAPVSTTTTPLPLGPNVAFGCQPLSPDLLPYRYLLEDQLPLDLENPIDEEMPEIAPFSPASHVSPFGTLPPAPPQLLAVSLGNVDLPSEDELTQLLYEAQMEEGLQPPTQPCSYGDPMANPSW